MSRIVLVHWNAGEAEERAARLRGAGHEVRILSSSEELNRKALVQSPPDVFVIDLTRLPSQGCAVAVALRQKKATRTVPLVFIEGDPEKTARVRALLPDASYTGWPRIRSALRAARAPVHPVVPGTMSGYAGTPLPKKLGIKPGSHVLLLNAPDGFEKKLEPLPPEVRLSRAGGSAGIVLLFATSPADLRKLPAAVCLWILWPKKASGLASDLTQVEVRRLGMAAGLVDYKVCAVDETWSGLAFARRK